MSWLVGSFSFKGLVSVVVLNITPSPEENPIGKRQKKKTRSVQRNEVNEVKTDFP